jgi:hypothetical protein
MKKELHVFAVDVIINFFVLNKEGCNVSDQYF